MMNIFPIIFKLKNEEISIKLILNSRVTFIEGDSSTGKTYIFKKIYGIIKEPVLKSEYRYNFNPDKVYVCLNEVDLTYIYNKVNCIIFIDRFDFFLSDKLLNFVNTSNNIFVLSSRIYDIDITCSQNDIWYIDSYKKGNKLYLESKNSF